MDHPSISELPRTRAARSESASLLDANLTPRQKKNGGLKSRPPQILIVRF